MPYYKSANLLFIHIPKTGGSNIEAEIKKNHNETLRTDRARNELLPGRFKNISLQHQDLTTIINYRNILGVDFTNIKIFTVVRNPYDRIISDLLWFRLIKPNYKPHLVLNVILNKYIYDRQFYDNHVRPQHLFISDVKGKLFQNVKIFKCEELNDKNDELNHFLGFKINIVRNNVNKDYSKYLNKNIITLVNKIYKKDFELFNYPMLDGNYPMLVGTCGSVRKP